MYIVILHMYILTLCILNNSYKILKFHKFNDTLGYINSHTGLGGENQFLVVEFVKMFCVFWKNPQNRFAVFYLEKFR